MDFDDREKGYSAVIYIMESSNSVVVHFGGFNDLKECRYFSHHIMEDFGIEQLLNVPQGVTVHQGGFVLKMPEIVIPYKPRELQNFLHKKIDKHRFSVLVLHRRAGKTVMMINQMIKAALTCPLPNPRYAFISPTFKQGKATAWDYIKQFAGKIPGTKFNESELRCDLPNGSRITILGAENDQAIRGISLDGCVFDETQSIKPTIFPEVIRPALADRKGWCIFIGTPKGRNSFYQLYQRALQNKEWYACTHKASETGILDNEELQAAQDVMSKDLYEQEFECSFQAAITGSYYGSIIEDLAKEGVRADDVALLELLQPRD